MVTVRLDRVTKRFGKVIAVNNVSLEIPDGKLTVLLGPSGSGKTTLLYLIAGIYKPNSGRIFFDERDVTSLTPSQRNVGLVFQNYALYPHMTVYDNIAFPLKLKKVPKREIDRKVNEVAKLLKIQDLLDRYPSQLSGGQQQRVALARALVKEPSVLLLDEPLSNLDALLRIYIRTELKKLQKDLGITTIYVTHDQSEAMAIADKIVVINNGVIQQEGTPSEIYEDPRNLFVATFIGNPPSNVLRGSVIRHGENIYIDVAGSKLMLSRGIRDKIARLNINEIIIAFRPEHIILSKEPLEGHISIEADVYAIEPLGRETIVTLMVKDSVVKSVTMSGDVPSPGERVFINVEPKRVKLFDPSSGINIEYIE